VAHEQVERVHSVEGRLKYDAARCLAVPGDPEAYLPTVAPMPKLERPRETPHALQMEHLSDPGGAFRPSAKATKYEALYSNTTTRALPLNDGLWLQLTAT
jgi:hypothetical protein